MTAALLGGDVHNIEGFRAYCWWFHFEFVILHDQTVARAIASIWCKSRFVRKCKKSLSTLRSEGIAEALGERIGLVCF